MPPDQDANEFELRFSASDVRLDILTTRDPAAQGRSRDILQKFGEGIQQIEIHVRDVDRATEILAHAIRACSRFIPRRARARNGTRVNFFLVPSGRRQEMF